MEAAVCSCVLLSQQFCLNSITWKYSLQMNWSGLRLLAYDTASILGPNQDSSQIFYCCSVSWRSCSFGSTGRALSHVPAVLRWCGQWHRTTESPGSGLRWQLSWSGLLDLLHPYNQGRIFCFQALVSVSPALMTPVPALPLCPVELHESLS